MRTLLFIRENKTEKKLIEYMSVFTDYTIIEKKDEILKELQSGKEHLPYDLLVIEMEESDLSNTEFIEKIRETEKNDQNNKIKIIILLDLDIQYKFEDQNSLNADGYLIKPYENSEFDEILLKLGFGDLLDGKKTDPSIKELTDLKNLIYNNRLKDQEFRIYVEKKVKEIGSAGEKLLGELICLDHIEFITRVNLIRVAGYIRTPILLSYLEKNLINKNNITIIKETIIAISKFNNLESIKILDNALTEIDNTLLFRKINEEIVKIKQNNPILGLLPRFMEGDKDNKKFRVTVNILKEILSPSDSEIFVKYLSDKSKIISEGAFEILSVKGNSSIHLAMNGYFKRSILVDSSEVVSDINKIGRLSLHYKNYLLLFPELITKYSGEIKTLLNKIENSDGEKHLISIMANSSNIEDIDLVKELYLKDKNLQDDIITQFSRNKDGVKFLFETYRSDTAKGNFIIKTLLNTVDGTDYFMKNFFNEGSDIQETIVRNIFIRKSEDKLFFIEKVFNSQLFNIKRIIFSRIMDFYNFSLRSILFDERFDREFFSIEKEYLLAASKVFPIALIDRLIFKMSTNSFPLIKIKRFLTTIQNIQKHDPVILFKNEETLISFIDSIISKNSIELNITTLDIFRNFNILDLSSYNILTKGLNYFYSKRGDKISPKETGKIHSIRKFYISHFKDLKKKKDFIKEFKGILAKKPINFDQLRQFVKYSNMAIAFSIDEFIDILIDGIKNSEPESQVKWKEFLGYLPLIKKIVLERISKESLPGDVQEKLRQYIRLVISFHNREMSALFYDQLKALFPAYYIEIDPDKLESNDILICDSKSFKAFIDDNTLRTSNIFLLLDNNNEFVSFKKYNPKFFVKPFSLNKVVHQLYQTLYFINEEPLKF